MVKPSQRIVSLLSSATEILCAIGVGDRIVAISHECDYPPEIMGLPRVSKSLVDSNRSSGQIDDDVRAQMAAGRPLYELDVERIAELRPQWIVTQSQCDVCAIDYRQVAELVAQDPRLAGTEVLDLQPGSVSDVLEDVLRIGRAVGAEQAAVECATELRRRIYAVREKTADIPVEERPRTICIEWIDPLMLAANWTPELIEWAGGQNGLTVAGRHSTYSRWDEVVQFEPETILVAPCGFDLPRTIREAQTLKEWPGWRNLPAVRDSLVYGIDGSAFFNRSGPRLVESLEMAAHLLQPARFPAPPAGTAANAFARLQF